MSDPHENGDDPIVRPVVIRLSDVEPEQVTWLWPGRLAAGKIALIVGDPGLGKSWVTHDIAARVSAGCPWPDGAVGIPASDVLMLSAEDGLADTIRPRLDALGADVSRVHHLAVLRCREAERPVQLADTGPLELAIAETGARLLIIDPISAYLGSTDSHRDSEVRGLLAPLAAMAERTRIGLIGVMHLAKSAQRPAIYRAVGSIAFAAAARIVMAVAADEEHDGRRILASVKCNLAASPEGLAYSLTSGRLVWESDPVRRVDVDALLAGPSTDRQERRAAVEWLKDMLNDGPSLTRELQAAAREAGHAWRTIERAKQKLGIEAELIGYGARGRWYWRLPETDNGGLSVSGTGYPETTTDRQETPKESVAVSTVSGDRQETDRTKETADSNQVVVEEEDSTYKSEETATPPPYGISRTAWARQGGLQ